LTLAGAGGDLGGEDRAAGRSRFDEPHWKPARGVDRGEPAARGHEVDGAAELLDAQRVVHAGEIAVDQWLHIGVGDRRRGALVLADLRAHLARERDGELRHRRFEDRSSAPLMLGIDVGVYETDGDALD